MDEMFIDDSLMWSGSSSGNFVQTHILKLEKGKTDLRLLWKDRIAGSNDTNATDIQTVYLSENAGDPYLDLFELTEEEERVLAEEKTAAELNGDTWQEPELFSTFATIELQFMKSGESASAVEEHMKTNMLLDGEWAKELWLNKDCFKGETEDQICVTNQVPRCDYVALSAIFGFGFNHSKHYVPDDYTPENEKTPIGGNVNVFCAQGNKRITSDEFDDDPDDFLMTINCGFDTTFVMPEQGFPDCKSWCPADKPVPPSYTGLNIHPDYDNDKEYWEGESIKYICNDTTLGIDRNDTIEKTYQCLIDEPTGRFAVPKNGSEWPACLKRTTTPHPAILSAFSIVRSRSDHDLIQEETNKAYISERNAGDEDYYLTKLIPALCLLGLLVMLCLCCTRIDNPLCKYCSKNYGELQY